MSSFGSSCVAAVGCQCIPGWSGRDYYWDYQDCVHSENYVEVVSHHVQNCDEEIIGGKGAGSPRSKGGLSRGYLRAGGISSRELPTLRGISFQHIVRVG